METKKKSKPDLNDLIGETLKEPVLQNMQVVTPVKKQTFHEEEEDKEVQFQFWLPESLLHRVKQAALRRRMKYKNLLILAITEHLDRTEDNKG